MPWDTVVTCTFVNRLLPEPGTIIVQKVTDPAGDETEFEFEFGEGSFTLAHGEEEVIDDLEAGTYSVSENTPEGWDLTSAVCDDESDPDEIDLDEGETVTCVFTNTKRGSIIVEKQTNPNGASGSFTFAGDASGAIGDGGQIVVSDLEPGSYSSTEAAAAGWLLTSIECDDDDSTGDLGQRTASFEVDAGETVKCVFTNSQITVGRRLDQHLEVREPDVRQGAGRPGHVLGHRHEHVERQRRDHERRRRQVRRPRRQRRQRVLRRAGQPRSWGVGQLPVRRSGHRLGGNGPRERRVRRRRGRVRERRSRPATTPGSRSPRSSSTSSS